MRHYSHAKAGPAISTQSRKERRVRKGAAALESRKPTSAKDRLRRLAARSRRHGREQVPAMSRSHAAHFVSFVLPDTERASCQTRKRASPFTERFRVNKFLVPGFWFRDIGFAAKRLATSFICYPLSVICGSPAGLPCYARSANLCGLCAPCGYTLFEIALKSAASVRQRRMGTANQPAPSKR